MVASSRGLSSRLLQRAADAEARISAIRQIVFNSAETSDADKIKAIRKILVRL